MPLKEKLWASYEYTRDSSPHEGIKYLKQLQKVDNLNPAVYFSLGYCYSFAQQYDNAILEYQNALEIYNKWGLKPMWVFNYTNLGSLYHLTGQYKEEKKLYKKAEQDFPDNLSIIRLQSILSLAEGDTVEANRYIEKLISILKENSASNAVIATNLGIIYNNVGILDKA